MAQPQKKARNSKQVATSNWREQAARLHGRDYVALVEQRARASDPEAVWLLGTLYEDGYSDRSGATIIDVDQRRAATLYRRGVLLGHVGCMLNLSNLLAKGRGVRRDPREALKLDRRAARLGSCTGAFNAGILYRALGRHRDAVRWFRKAAELGDEGALLEVAKSQLLGQGTRRDVASALEHLRRVERSRDVAECQAEEARLILAYLNLDGSLIARSYLQGMRWLRRAAEHGSTVAAEMEKCFRR